MAGMWGMMREDVETDLESYGWSWKVLLRKILWSTCLDSLKCCWGSYKDLDAWNEAITDLIWFVLAVEPGGKEEKCIKMLWWISHGKANFPKVQALEWSWVKESEQCGTTVKKDYIFFYSARLCGLIQGWKFRKIAAHGPRHQKDN